MFQFYISSIKTIWYWACWSTFPEFQFYISSIKTMDASGIAQVARMFQFYISSIKTPLQELFVKNFPSFNSTLVRLRLA